MAEACRSFIGMAMVGLACVSVRSSPFAPERPPSAPKATTTEKATVSAERSILLRIVGFVLT